MGLAGFRLARLTAVDLQPIRAAGREKVEAFRLQGTVAPGAGLDRDWPIPLARLPPREQGMGGFVVAIAGTAELVGGGGLAHPHADLKRPVAQQIGMAAAGALLPLQLQGTDQGGGPAQLIEGEQAQGVAHQHRDPGRLDAGVG